MQSISIEDIINALPKVHADRNYWFVRTQGGQYYDDFYEHGFIAIGLEKIIRKLLEE